MGGNGGGMIPGRPIPARSGSPGGRSPTRGGVGNPETQIRFLPIECSGCELHMHSFALT